MENQIVYMGGSTAGIIGLLTMKTLGYDIIGVVTKDKNLAKVANDIDYIGGCHSTIKDVVVIDKLTKSDYLVCVHGREIIPKHILEMPKHGCINIHPYLYAYKGADPIGRAIKEQNFNASVGAHYMTEDVDLGEVLCEEFMEVPKAETHKELYDSIYCLYISVITKVFRNIY